MSVRAGIVVTGTEVLTGQIQDRNGPWISEQLAREGVEVAEILCVGDRVDDLLAALGHMRDLGLDLIVTTGGLGPTADDLTAEVVGRFAGRELRLDPEMEAKIHRILEGFAKRMRFDMDAVAEANRKQAMIPVGATAIDPAGTAPGLVVPAGDVVVIVMPGPPRELHEMWPVAIATGAARAVLDRAPELTTRTMKMFGIPESTLAQSLREIGEEADIEAVEITTCLRGGELVIDVRHRPGQDEITDAVFAGLMARHGDFIYSEDGESIEQVVAAELGGRTLAVAESCTAGLLAARLTDKPGASAWFAGGVVAYSNAAKTELLGVPSELIAEHGAVSEQVAEAMADGAIERFGTDFGIAITGVAGPDGGTEEKPVGFVCFCAKAAGGELVLRSPTIPGSRTEIRLRSAVVGLHLLRYLMQGREPPL